MLLDLFGLWNLELLKGASSKWLERDGKILVFRNATEVAKFLKAEKEREISAKDAEKKPIPGDSRWRGRDKETADIPKPQIVYIDTLQTLLLLYQRPDNVSEMIRRSEIEALLKLQQLMFQMEEDDLILLMSA